MSRSSPSHHGVLLAEYDWGHRMIKLEISRANVVRRVFYLPHQNGLSGGNLFLFPFFEYTVSFETEDPSHPQVYIVGVGCVRISSRNVIVDIKKKVLEVQGFCWVI